MKYYYEDNSGAIVAVVLAAIVFSLIIAAALYVVTSIFYARLFAKAGVQGTWRGWVPIYRELIFVKLGDLNPWWLLVLFGATFVINLIPYIGLMIGWLPSLAAGVYLILAAYRIQTKLGKEGAWVVLYILLSVVWLGIMAFDKSRWNPQVPPSPWAQSFLADTSGAWQGVPVQPAAHGGFAQPGYAAGGYPPPGGYAPPSADYVPPAPAAHTLPTAAPTAPQPPAGPGQPPTGATPPTEPRS